MPDFRDRFFIRSTLTALVLLILWDAGGWDLALAHLFGDARGFTWNRHWLLVDVLHAGARNLNLAMVVVLAWMVWRPSGVLTRLSLAERITVLAGLTLALLAVGLLKRFSVTSCPWDLAEFGGRSLYLSHWVWTGSDGGPGHCFPAGHASAGFAWFAVYFGLRRKAPGAARWAAAMALLAGCVLGVAQQMRGAHFMSHTLWTAWICWTVAGGAQALAQRWTLPRRRSVEAIGAMAAPAR